MQDERSKMLAPNPILHDPPDLLGNVRAVLSLRPNLEDYPRRLAEYLSAEEWIVRECLETIRDERGEVLI